MSSRIARGARDRWGILGASFLLVLILTSRAETGRAQPYWESFPAAADSSDSARTVFRDPPMPIGEAIFYWPVRVVAEPFVLLASGIGEATEYLDSRKTFQKVSKLLGPRRGPFGVVPSVQAGGLSGFGLGLSIEHDAFFKKGNLLRLRGSGTVNGDTRLSIGMRFPSREGEYFDFGTGYRMRANARFFGIGPDTKDEDESFYRQELFWSGAALRRGFGANFFWEGDLLYSSIAAGEPRKDAPDPSISEQFAGNLPPGFGEHSYGVSLGLQLLHEDDRGLGRATKGGSRRVRVERFESTDGRKVGIWSYRTELQQFFTLWHPYRVLALRGYGSWLDPTGSAPIPFQRLMVNDNPDMLRGFRAFRFRDRGMVALNSEYRFPVLMKQRPGGSGVDLYPLADWGQVFDAAEQIGFKRMNFTYGLGLRVESERGFIARFEWARSEEENTFLLRMDQIYQFIKLGFLYGRDPIPSR
jgi:surface antigen Omp85-like protein